MSLVITPVNAGAILLHPGPTGFAGAPAGSMRNEGSYLRYVGRTPEERKEQRKAARLSLDTSAHAGSEYRRFVRECSAVRCSVFLWRPWSLHDQRGCTYGA